MDKILEDAKAGLLQIPREGEAGICGGTVTHQLADLSRGDAIRVALLMREAWAAWATEFCELKLGESPAWQDALFIAEELGWKGEA